MGILCLVLAAAGTAEADVVLLRNGSVLEGEVRREGEVFTVRVESGGEMRLPDAEVRVVQPTLVGVYDWLREERAQRPPAAEERLGLAEWCLRNSLWPQASLELLEARALAPGSERVALLERRLMLLSEAPAARPSGRPPEAAADSPDGRPRSAEAPSLSLPDHGLTTFARRIQPLLLNNCTTGGCHNPSDGGGFPLDRRLLRGYGDSRSTEANLRSVLAAIDVTSPAESPLLIAARGPHAGGTPLRGPRREEWLGRLEAWVDSIAAAQPAEALPAPPVAASPVRTVAYDAPPTAEAPAAEPSVAAAGDPTGPSPQAADGHDEFDPRIFNRRFRTAKDDLPLVD